MGTSFDLLVDPANIDPQDTNENQLNPTEKQ